MKKILLILAGLIVLGLCTERAIGSVERYGSQLCNDPRVDCYTVRQDDTWENLFPNEDQRDVVMRLNRVNIRLRPGMVIAVPKHLPQVGILDISPFPLQIRGTGEKEVVVDLNKLAWAAYDANGHLVHWGPASGGRGYCSDIGGSCNTITGNFRIQRKQPAGCVSSIFPIESDGGAPMPYCMHFFSGFALHGSYDVPGYNASHGCVRMYINDARWLNEQFTDIGTKVVIKPY